MKPGIRTALFVPGTRSERFAKALAAGADTVIIDLEDAVEFSLKEQARDNISAFAKAHPQAEFMVRINGANTAWFEEDLAICERYAGISTVLLPKAESAAQIARAAVAGKPVLPIIESAKGVLALNEMAACRDVERLSFGTLDLMLELGTTPDTNGARQLLDHIRCQILLYSAAHGLGAPLDGVYPDFSDTEGLSHAAAHVRDMGFCGMLCIHPAQVAVVNSVFAATEAELAWARRVVETADATQSSAFQQDGKMIDAPVIERARRLLAR